MQTKQLNCIRGVAGEPGFAYRAAEVPGSFVHHQDRTGGFSTSQQPGRLKFGIPFYRSFPLCRFRVFESQSDICQLQDTGIGRSRIDPVLIPQTSQGEVRRNPELLR